MTTPEHIWINDTPNVVCGSFDTEPFDGSVEYIRADLYDNTILEAAAEMLADEHGWVRRERLEKAVDRIEELERERDGLVAILKQAVAGLRLLKRAEAAEAKLAKAAKCLRWYADHCTPKYAGEVLAELEGKE